MDIPFESATRIQFISKKKKTQYTLQKTAIFYWLPTTADIVLVAVINTESATFPLEGKTPDVTNENG